MFCSNCGKEIKGEGSFCEFCGASKTGGVQGNTFIGGQSSNIYSPITGILMKSWQTVVPAIVGALFILFPISDISLSIFGYSGIKGEMPAYAYFDKVGKLKQYMEDYWYGDLNLWIIAILIADIVAIYFAYKMITCLLNSRLKTYIGDYAKYTSISSLVAAIGAFIFNLRCSTMFKEALDMDAVKCVNTFWVWAVGIIALVNIFILSKNYNDYIYYSDERERKQDMMSSGGWVCKKCGLVNPNYTGTCSCGNPKYNN
ncbi:MAG: hypothetical protein ACI4EX_02980 [Lachnospiraceae bacterium]